MHDRVNQCHGSQSGCLALVKQACGGPDDKVFFFTFPLWDLISMLKMFKMSRVATEIFVPCTVPLKGPLYICEFGIF